MVISSSISAPVATLRAGDVVASQYGVYLGTITDCPALRTGVVTVYCIENPWGGLECVKYGAGDYVALFDPAEVAVSGETDVWVKSALH